MTTLRLRDKKEEALSTLEMQVAIHKDRAVRIDEVFDKKLAEYQTWKTEKQIPGIKY